MEKKKPKIKTETVIIGVLHTLVTIAAVVTIVRACITVNAEENTKRYSYYAYQEHVMYNVFWAEAIIENSFYAETNYPIAAYSELIYTDATYGDCYSYVLCKLSSTGILEAYTLPVVESVLIKNDGVTNASNYIVENGLSTLCSGNDTAYHRYRTSTNIPIFNTRDEVLNYLQTGDKTGQLNTFEQDDTLALAGFDCDNTVKATWTDYVCNREINPDHLTIGVSAVYTDGKNSSQVAQNVVRYSAMSFEKAYADYAALNPYGEAAELVLKFLPMYMDTESGTTYEGRAISVYFNADGSVREIIEGGVGSGSGNQSDNVNVQYLAPELSNLGHNGFKVLNMDYANQQLYLDIKMESFLYGVKHEKVAGSWLCVTDLAWRYREHDYGYLDRDVLVNQSTVDIKELYGFDNVQKLTDDFLTWSEEYPKHWDLPTYSFLKASSAAKTQYALRNVYNSSSNDSAETQMIKSEQACTTYYVRFYTIENDVKTYGPWMQYVYRDGANIFGANISTGEVYEDEDGNFIVTNQSQGTQDYDTGDITYDSDKEWYELSVDKAMDSGMSGFKDTITEIGGTVSVLPDYVAKLFSFLPWWCNALIAAGVGAVVVLRFLGR